MSPYSSKLHLSPSLCLQLLCPLLLLGDSSCTRSDRNAGGITPFFTTPATNCSTGCDDGSFGTHATTKEYSDTNSTAVATDSLLKTLMTESTTNVQSPENLPSSTTTTTVKPNDSVTSAISSEQTTEGAHSSTASPSYVQPSSPDRLTEAATSVLPFTTTGLPAQSLRTGFITSTGSRTETTAGNVHSVSTSAPAPATTRAAAAPHSPTTVKTTANASISVSTAYTANMPHPSTGVEPIQTSSLTTSPSAVTVTSADASANESKTSASAARVPVVEEAGGALTRQLMDTASLLAVLLFGLLFFLVTVAVFVKQAYESYRRKDYTQVDYLINGMYSDSGV